MDGNRTTTPTKFTRDFNINPDYVNHLEQQINKIKTAINLSNSWIKNETLGIYPSRIYLACLHDIDRIINPNKKK